MQPHRTIDLPEELIDEIQYEIPEVSYDAAVHHLRRTIVDFCEQSHYWQEDLGPIRIATGAAEYELPVQRSVSVVSIVDVHFTNNANVIVPLVRSDDANVRYRYWQTSPTLVEFFPHAELIDRDVSVIVALKPEIFNETFKFSATLLRDYRDAIVAGAKAALYKTPRKPWTDMGQFQYNDGLFTAKSAEALRRQGRGYSKLPDRSVRKARTYF